MGERAFSFLDVNRRAGKPRTRGLTEIRGPYYTPLGRRQLEDLLEGFGDAVDSLKFAGGAFTLMRPAALRELIDTAHEHDVLVSTGGFIERVLVQGQTAADRYIGECRDHGFDVIEVSAGFVSLPADDWVRLVRRVRAAGLRAKPEIGIQFGAGGATPATQLAHAGTADPGRSIELASRFLDAGADLIMLESEGITENVEPWRTDVVARIAAAIGPQRVMFEAADPAVFTWYVKNFGPDVNLFVDHSQIVQLEALRCGIWGTFDTWGRVVWYAE